MKKRMTAQGKGLLYAFAGIIILSPDTLLVRLLDMEQWTMQFYRGAGVLVGVCLIMAVFSRHGMVRSFTAIGRIGVLAGFCYAMASLLFVSSLYHTTVANTLAIISTAPVWSALMTRFFLKSSLPLRTWAAVVLSLIAIFIIVAGDIRTGRDNVTGDLLALLQALFMAASLILVRSRKEVNMIPCIGVGGLFICCTALLFTPSLEVESGSISLLVLLVLVVIPASFALLTMAPRYITAPEVNMIMLLEMLFGPLLVWMVVGETVPATTIIGGTLLFTVLLVHSLLTLNNSRRVSRVSP